MIEKGVTMIFEPMIGISRTKQEKMTSCRAFVLVGRHTMR